MPAKGPVSILWQIIFVVFVPIADIWAFYRIKKLRKAILYYYGPVLVLMIVGGALMFNMVFEDPEAFQEMSEGLEESIAFSIISTVGGIGLQIFGIYLIYKWSEEWNKQFSNTIN